MDVEGYLNRSAINIVTTAIIAGPVITTSTVTGFIAGNMLGAFLPPYRKKG